MPVSGNGSWFSRAGASHFDCNEHNPALHHDLQSPIGALARNGTYPRYQKSGYVIKSGSNCAWLVELVRVTR
jgi:hypothetical protein